MQTQRARKGKGGEWAMRSVGLYSFADKDLGIYIQKGRYLRMIIRGCIVEGDDMKGKEIQSKERVKVVKEAKVRHTKLWRTQELGRGDKTGRQ